MGVSLLELAYVNGRLLCAPCNPVFCLFVAYFMFV